VDFPKLFQLGLLLLSKALKPTKGLGLESYVVKRECLVLRGFKTEHFLEVAVLCPKYRKKQPHRKKIKLHWIIVTRGQTQQLTAKYCIYNEDQKIVPVMIKRKGRGRRRKYMET